MDEQTVWATPVDERDDSSLGPAIATGAVTMLVSLFALYPWLVNTLGPFDDRQGLGVLATFVLAALAGVLLGVVSRAVRRRGRVEFGVLVVALAAGAFVLFPTRVDRHESFVERPNERSACTGVTFGHYPPGMADGSSTLYCVGFERSLPDG